MWCELRDSNLLLNIFRVLGGSQFQQKTADMTLFSVNIMENRFGEKLKPVKASVAVSILARREMWLILKSLQSTAGRSGFVCGKVC